MTVEERNKLVMDNAGFAVFMARRIVRNRLDIWRVGEKNDAYQIAFLAMIESADKFEEGRSKFTSYTGFHIAHRLLEAVETGGVVKPATGTNQRTTADKIRKLRKRTARNYYLSGDYIGDYTDNGDWIVDPHNEQRDNEEDEQRAADIRMVWQLLECLFERERYIIEQRFFHDKTLQDLADEKGLSRERIRQIEDKALRRMRLRAEEIVNRTPKQKRQEALRKWNELFPDEETS